MPSIKSNFSLKAEDIDKVSQAILRVGTTSEEVINNYLHDVAGKDITKSITRFIPVSKKGKRHAKHSNWSEQENFNMAVSISNSLKGSRGSSFYYLYYVVTGTGTSKKKGANDFMEKGMNQEYNNIVKGLIDTLDKNIEKEMN